MSRSRSGAPTPPAKPSPTALSDVGEAYKVVKGALEEARQHSQLFGNPSRTQWFRDALAALEMLGEGNTELYAALSLYVETDAAGTTNVGTNISATVSDDFADAVTVTGDTTISAPTVMFEKTLDGPRCPGESTRREPK